MRAAEPTQIYEWRYHTLEPRHPNLCRRLQELAWEHVRNYLPPMKGLNPGDQW